jgi:hypothetical protein
MREDIFSWQQNDYAHLCSLKQHRIVFVHSKDTISQYHVFSHLNRHLQENGYQTFMVSKYDPYLISPLLPYVYAVNLHGVQRTNLGKGLAANIIKDITGLDSLKQVIQNISDSSQGSSLLLNERENDLLIHIKKSAEMQIPIFIFYGYPFFDSASKNLTLLLLSGALDNDFQYLKEARYYFVCEPEDNVDSYFEVKKFEHIDVSLTEPKPKDIKEILCITAPSLILSEAEQNKLFFLSGGRLSVIDIISRYLVTHKQTISNCTSNEVVKLALDDRIQRLENNGLELKNILETAAIIGDAFPIPLLKSVTNQIAQCSELLKKSDQEFLTKCNEEIGRFLYIEVWNYFKNLPCEQRKKDISFAVAEAIKLFNPYDYLSRAFHMESAGKIKEACELYIIAYNSTIQEGYNPPIELTKKISQLCSACDLGTYWNMLLEYYNAVQAMNFDHGLSILEEIPQVTSTRMLLLKEYLSGLCSHRAGDTLEQQHNALISIEKAADYSKGLEDGLWCDCQTILISLYVNFFGDLTSAQAICKKLTYYYTEKIYAPFAEKGLHVLERKYSALYSVERAVIKTKRSVEYFSNGKYPKQYLMALNNHAANLIVLGQFADAIFYLQEASKNLAEYEPANINRMYIVNNLFLCAVLLGKFDASEAYKKISQMVQRYPFGDWKIIILLNCAIYLALSGDFEGALRELLNLEYQSKKIGDDYYLYYTYSNLAAVFYLQGKNEQAITMLTTKCEHPPALFKTTEKLYLRERTKHWKEIMATQQIQDPQIFDKYLLSQHPTETQWSFIGRGFLYSDIQFWSEP